MNAKPTSPSWDPVANMLSLNGEKLRSVTGSECALSKYIGHPREILFTPQTPTVPIPN